MKLELASYKAVKYACLHFHYAAAVPLALCSFSVFNDAGQWCGCIVYSPGSNRHIAHKYNLPQGKVCELVRMALNGSQESTSKALALSLKLLKKYNPLMKVVVSYADCDQSHTGTIYQATNWIYEGLMEQNGGTPKYRVHGKVTHGRTINKRRWKQNINWIRQHVDPKAELVYTLGKHKYCFPLTKDMVQVCRQYSVPFPKQNAVIAQLVECQPNQVEDGVRVDLTAQFS